MDGGDTEDDFHAMLHPTQEVIMMTRVPRRRKDGRRELFWLVVL